VRRPWTSWDIHERLSGEWEEFKLDIVDLNQNMEEGGKWARLAGMGNVRHHSCVTISFEADGEKKQYSYGASKVQTRVPKTRKRTRKVSASYMILTIQIGAL
jgi:hypothetical protein